MKTTKTVDGCELGHHDWVNSGGIAPVGKYGIRQRTCRCCDLKDETSSWTGWWDFDEMTFGERQKAWRARQQ